MVIDREHLPLILQHLVLEVQGQQLGWCNVCFAVFFWGMLNAQDMIKTNTIPRPESFSRNVRLLQSLAWPNKRPRASKIVVLERDSYSKGVTMPRLQCLQLNLLKASGCTASKWWYQWNTLHFKKLGWKSSCLLSNTIHLEAISSTVLLCRSHHSWHQVVLCHLFLSSTCEDFPQNRRAYLELQLGKGPINQRTYCICQWVPISLNRHWICVHCILSHSVPCTA